MPINIVGKDGKIKIKLSDTNDGVEDVIINSDGDEISYSKAVAKIEKDKNENTNNDSTEESTDNKEIAKIEKDKKKDENENTNNDSTEESTDNKE